MPRLIMTKGLPASGKTTWAKTQKAKRVNKDDLRAMIDDGKWSKENEQFVLDIRDFIVTFSLLGGHDVIVDDTNLAPKHETTLRNIIKDYDDNTLVPGEKKPWTFEIKDFTDVSVDECIQRDRKRSNYVGEKVIRDMYNQFLKPNVAQYERKAGLPDCIICDIDGTLAHMNGRSPYDYTKVSTDKIDPIVRDILEYYRSEDEPTRVFLVSGRESSCEEDTKQWLTGNFVHYDRLFMRPEGDKRPDTEIKEEIFNDNIRDVYNVRFVLDDRKRVIRMWQSLGLKVLACTESIDDDF